MIRMKHPMHGFHDAYTTTEKEAMVKSGWVEDVPAPAAETTDDAVEGETVESLRAKLDALGITYHPNAGLKKLLTLLPAE